MEYRILGNTNLRVSELGFGGWAISGNGYGPTDDNESVLTLHEALESGINFIDTADSYGKGHSEELIGRVLSERKDNKTIIATKFGWDFYSKGGIKGNLLREYIEFALENSLKRLKRDWIDIYQIHNQRPDKIDQFKVIETLEKLKDKGIIRYYGYSANYTSDISKLLSLNNVDTLQLKYNLISPEANQDIEKNSNLGIICREPLANGFLAGKYDRNSKFKSNDHRYGFSRNKIDTILSRVEQFRFLENNIRSLKQASIKFCLMNHSIGVTVVGIKNRLQLKENLESIDSQISPQEFSEIQKIQAKWT